MIRTVNERLRAMRKIILQRDSSGILFALRTEIGADGKSSFVEQTARFLNTLKSAMIRKYLLEKDPIINIKSEYFSEEADSTILVRGRVRGRKLGGAFEKVRRQVTGQAKNTITVLPKGGKP